MNSREFKKAILIGWATYRTASGQIAHKDFALGEVEHCALGCLDLDNINNIIKSKYKSFINNKTKKNQYKLVRTKVDIWTNENTKKEIEIEVNA